MNTAVAGLHKAQQPSGDPIAASARERSCASNAVSQFVPRARRPHSL